MGDCGLNCDFNASVIDNWERQTYQQRENAKKKNANYQREMAHIRKTHICHACKKYPGDNEYIFGRWENGVFECFDCI